MCAFTALGANSEIFPVTRSSNRAATEISRSHSLTALLAVTLPCMPSILRERGSVSGNPPRPIRVVVTGTRAFLASAVSSGAASPAITPPPAYSKGLFAWLIALASLSICFGCPLPEGGLYPRMLTVSGVVASVGARWTSFGISTRTGPGLPVDAISNASAMMRGRSSASFTR